MKERLNTVDDTKQESLNKLDWKKIVIVFLFLVPPTLIALGVIILIFSDKITSNLPDRMYELYEVFIVSGLVITWLIILAILRYSLSKRHNG